MGPQRHAIVAAMRDATLWGMKSLARAVLMRSHDRQSGVLCVGVAATLFVGSLVGGMRDASRVVVRR